jgi:hypothetical protein
MENECFQRKEPYSGACRHPASRDESSGHDHCEEDEHTAVHRRTRSRSQGPGEPSSLLRGLHSSIVTADGMPWLRQTNDEPTPEAMIRGSCRALSPPHRLKCMFFFTAFTSASLVCTGRTGTEASRARCP